MRSRTGKIIFALSLTVLVNGLLFLCLASLNSSNINHVPVPENTSVRWLKSTIETEVKPETSERSEHDLPPEVTEFPLPAIPEPLVLARADWQSNVRIPVQQPETPVEVQKKAPVQPVVQGAMDVDTVDQPPRPRRTREPSYPADARRQGQQGHVTIRLLINRNGRVDQFEILDRQGPSTFERSVEEVVKTWQFEPARHSGVPVAVRAVQTLLFRLNE
jgi:TonB family protein